MLHERHKEENNEWVYSETLAPHMFGYLKYISNLWVLLRLTFVRLNLSVDEGQSICKQPLAFKSSVEIGADVRIQYRVSINAAYCSNK